jgi:hypothetical protein
MAKGNKPGVRLVKQYHVFKDGTCWAEYTKRCTLLKGHKDKNGYHRYNIYGRDVEAHLLVAKQFLGPKPGPDYQVDHINRVRDDNHVENLRWVTRAENCENRIFGGTLKQAIEFVRASGFTVTPA